MKEKDLAEMAGKLKKLKDIIENYLPEDDKFVLVISNKNLIMQSAANVDDIDMMKILDKFVKILFNEQIDNLNLKLQWLVDNYPATGNTGIRFPDGDFIAKTKEEVKH